MNRKDFINRIRAKKDNKTNIISETENDITISCCNGRMIRSLSKNKQKKPPVAINLRIQQEKSL